MVSEKPVIGVPGRAASNESRPTNPDTGLLALIQISFPCRGELIERTFRNSRSFRTLCEDYRQCNEALQRLEQQSSTESDVRLQEYADLLVELGREVRAWLEAIDAESPLSSRETHDFGNTRNFGNTRRKR